ncbi:hypothetical protein F2Q68_00005448 [Brassica cretica]|uniref:Uncharacterized protein n=1 Tax=Brassica cretica TaxID=69181 RepID=A0A8S9JGJ9_BRACR|nr:hypothetical protein F2Q68_00005448 [Brassica cretica]
MTRSNKEERSSAQSPVHAERRASVDQFDHLVVDLGEALFQTFAGRAGTRPDRSVWSDWKHEPQLGHLECSGLYAGRTGPWTGANQ